MEGRVLTNEMAEGSYFLLGGGTVLSPSDGILFYYFTTKKLAKDYKQQRYAGAMYPVRVAQIS